MIAKFGLCTRWKSLSVCDDAIGSLYILDCDCCLPSLSTMEVNNEGLLWKTANSISNAVLYKPTFLAYRGWVKIVISWSHTFSQVALCTFSLTGPHISRIDNIRRKNMQRKMWWIKKLSKEDTVLLKLRNKSSKIFYPFANLQQSLCYYFI